MGHGLFCSVCCLVVVCLGMAELEPGYDIYGVAKQEQLFQASRASGK